MRGVVRLDIEATLHRTRARYRGFVEFEVAAVLDGPTPEPTVGVVERVHSVKLEKLLGTSWISVGRRETQEVFERLAARVLRASQKGRL